MTYYQILDVPPNATQEQIKDAYRILVHLHHPDRLQQVPASVRQYAEDRLKKINEAYGVLGDPERRARYDAAQARLRPAPERAAYGGYDEDDDGFGFGGVWDAAWEASRRQGRRRTRTAEQEAAEAAYEEWAHREAERYAEQREAERARRAERENREAEARARRAAEEQYPRARRQGDEVVVNFAPGVWTTLVRVPAGSFHMGSEPRRDPEATRNELPQHEVVLSEYFIGKYPVTNAQFRAFVRATAYTIPAPLPGDQETHPVVNVTWDDAVAFCRWLTRVTTRDFRLPTEAEWEKAARGPDGRIYPWGDAWEPAHVNGPTGPGRPAAVDAHSPAGDSPYGVAGTSGNVWEWCGDWFDGKLYARRADGVARDPQSPGTGPGYAARGGAFDSPPRHLRSAYRTWFAPDARQGNLGFRMVVRPFAG